MVRASTEEATSWDELLPFCLFAYRSTPHRVTNESPAYLLYGRELRGPHHVGLLDATPPTPEADRLEKDGRLYYERYMLACESPETSRTTRPAASRIPTARIVTAAPTPPPPSTRMTASSYESPKSTIRISYLSNGIGKAPSASPLMESWPTGTIVSPILRTDVDVKRFLATACASTSPSLTRIASNRMSSWSRGFSSAVVLVVLENTK